jgi:2-polyprenyl-3-methyl-5-hydroxy-6-metoxy-1,4-benzoquinol methylase
MCSIDPVGELWKKRLLVSDFKDLSASLITELANYLGKPYSEVKKSCEVSVELGNVAWQQVDTTNPQAVLNYYKTSLAYLYELTRWHSLQDDRGFADSVICMEYAKRNHLYQFLDFGCGIGSHAIIMVAEGLQATLFDVSDDLVTYAKWRMEQRRFSAEYISGNPNTIPGKYDFILALDVLEHIPNPYETLKLLRDRLSPNGILCISVPSTPLPARPLHYDYFRKHLRADTKSLGLAHIKSLIYIDIFTRDEAQTESLLSPPAHKVTFWDELIRELLRFGGCNELIVFLALRINIYISQVIQLFHWHTFSDPIPLSTGDSRG